MVWLKQKSRLNLFCSDRKYLSTEHVQLTFKKRGLWKYQANKTRNYLHCACVYLNTSWVLRPESLQKTDITYIFIYYLQLVWEGCNQSINQYNFTHPQFVRHYRNFQCAWVSELFGNKQQMWVWPTLSHDQFVIQHRYKKCHVEIWKWQQIERLKRKSNMLFLQYMIAFK